MSLTCPACTGLMVEHRFDGHYGRQVAIDLCSGCNGLWFDDMESHQLAPGATLSLFRQMAEAVETSRRPLASRKPCPRCREPLTRALDKQRGTPFEDFRCPRGHGRYMTFVSFLRAKSFVRDLTPGEVNELRRHVRIIKCTNCSATVDITSHSACAYCRAPLAMLDADQLEKTVRSLQAAEERRQTVDPALPLRLAHERLKTERVFAEAAAETRRHPGVRWSSDSLVDQGLRALGGLLDQLGQP